MKKRGGFDDFSRKRTNAAKRQKKKQDEKEKAKTEPPAPPPYKYMVVRKIVFRIGYISNDLATVGMDVCFKYRHNVDAEFNDMMQDVAENNTAGKDMAARFVQRYDHAINPIPPDDDGPELDEQGNDSDPGEEDDDDDEEEEEDEEEELEEDNDPDGGEARDKKRARTIKTVKFRMFTKASRLPVLNPYAGFVCTLRDPKPETFPPSYDDLDITSITNVYPPGGLAIYKVMRMMKKMGRWIGDPLKKSKDKLKIQKRKPAGMEPRFTKLEDLMMVLGTSEHRVVALTLFRDVFRGDDFYWMIGLVPRYRLSMLTDEVCAKIHSDLMLGNIMPHVFETKSAPLEIDRILAHAATRKDLRKSLDGMEIALNAEPLATASRLWTHWWTRSGLYRGLYEWDVEDTTAAAAAAVFLESRGYVVSIDATVVPTFILTHFKQLHMAMALPKRTLEIGVLMGDISMLIPAMAPLFGTMNISTKRMVLCPTLQSVKHSTKATGGLECYNMSRGDRKELAGLVTKYEVFVLADMHLFGAAQLSSAIVEIATRAAKLALNKRRCYMILCGVNATPIHSEMQGPNCMWSHLLASELRLSLPSFQSPSPALITSDTLDECRNSMADKGPPRSVALSSTSQLMLFTLPSGPTDTAEMTGGPLAPEDVARIVSSLVPAVKSMVKYMAQYVGVVGAPLRPTLFLFENHTHMEQIMGTAEFSGEFPRDVLVVGCWAVECDGGHRRIEKLWIRAGPTAFEAQKSIRVSAMAPELIFYQLEHDHHTTQRCYETRPITPSFYTTISHARFSPDPGLDILAIFTMTRKKFRRTALNTLAYLARGNLVLVALEKTNGTQIHEDERAFRINLFDLATPLPGDEGEDDDDDL